jgi:hypothetical protein
LITRFFFYSFYMWTACFLSLQKVRIHSQDGDDRKRSVFRTWELFIFPHPTPAVNLMGTRTLVSFNTVSMKSLPVVCKHIQKF